MSPAELDREIAAGVTFWGYEAAGELLGVMGIQPVRDVVLIRHAYVAPASQRSGVGGALLEHLARASTRRRLVGTWAAAEWRFRFYRRHGLGLGPPPRAPELLRSHWSTPPRQTEAPAGLASPPLDGT